MARGGIEPPTRGFSVPKQATTIDHTVPQQATTGAVSLVACCPSSQLGIASSSTTLAQACDEGFVVVPVKRVF